MGREGQRDNKALGRFLRHKKIMNPKWKQIEARLDFL